MAKTNNSKCESSVDRRIEFVREESHQVDDHSYVLMTASHNEEANIDKTIESVLRQTLLPKRWVIVSDNSTDRTDEIIQGYAAKHDFIRFLRVTRPPGRSFASKVVALRHGSKFLEETAYQFIGNIDSDVSVEPQYFESIIDRLRANPQLGIAGGFVCEELDGEFQSRKTNSVHSVAHAAQLVRRECYEAIGGYAILEYGGEDWHAQMSAQMMGWIVEAFPELKIFHHRSTGTSGSLLRYLFRQGRMDYAFGSAPLFEFFKCCGRLLGKPFLIGAMTRFGGFAWSYIRRDKRPVSNEFIAFLRKEQMSRVSSLLNRGSTHAKQKASSARESEVRLKGSL
jgi:poly-beta-1,6-N-acetyl-D-glucosamine synthase